MTVNGYPLNTGQSDCVAVTVDWANGSIVNPTLMPSSVACEKHAAQPTSALSLRVVYLITEDECDEYFRYGLSFNITYFIYLFTYLLPLLLLAFTLIGSL